jgi:hypothetical protein
MLTATTATCLLATCPDCGETISAVAQVDERGWPYLRVEHPVPEGGAWCPSIRFTPPGPTYSDIQPALTEHGAVRVAAVADGRTS